MSNAFRKRGHECYTVDFDPQFPSSLHIDIMELTADMILESFGHPDIIWSGNECDTCSVAAIGYHRRKNPVTGVLEPKTEKAMKADMVNRHTLELKKELNPHFFFIENPMGALRHMDYMSGIPRYLITYCKYGFRYMKPTDIFTNHPHPDFLPPCSNGDKCHEAAPRGTKQGVQGIDNDVDRAKYPPLLCEHIVDICERDIDKPAKVCNFNKTIIYRDLFGI